MGITTELAARTNARSKRESTGPRRRWVVLALACAVGILAGCGALSAALQTESALTQAGFNNPRVNISSASHTGDVLSVTVDPQANSPAPSLQANSPAPSLQASIPGSQPAPTASPQASPPASQPAPTAGSQALHVASIVWKSYPYRFSTLDVNIRGTTTASWSFDQLHAAFGARPAGFFNYSATQQMARSAKGILTGFLIFVIIVAVIVIAVIVGAVILIIHLINRSRERRAARPYARYPSGSAYAPPQGYSQPQGYPGFPRYPQPSGPGASPPGPPPSGAPPPPSPQRPNSASPPDMSGLFGSPAGTSPDDEARRSTEPPPASPSASHQDPHPDRT